MERNKPKEYVMLVLTRKPDEQIRIGDDIVITIVRVKGNTIRVGIEAPKGVRVIRGELEGKPKESAPSESSEIILAEPMPGSDSVRSSNTRRANLAIPRSERRVNADRHSPADRLTANDRSSVEHLTKSDRVNDSERSVQNSSPLGSFVLAARIPMPNPVTTLNSRVG